MCHSLGTVAEACVPLLSSGMSGNWHELCDPSRGPWLSDNEVFVVEASYRDTALRYCTEDLPGASIPGARLQKILECLQLGQPVTPLSLTFLQKEGLEALHRLAAGGLPYDRFRDAALAEQVVRIEAASAAKHAREAEERARHLAAQSAAKHAREAEEQARHLAAQERIKLAIEQADAARGARESDPKFVARLRHRELRARYAVDTYVEQGCFSRLMEILERADAGQRLSEDDFVWLSTAGKDYFTEKLRAAYHHLVAKFFASAFEKTQDPWAAVNASGHYRKCHRAADAESILATINVEKQGSRKLKSALCTTHGGVMRDLGRPSDALRLGDKAHAYRPDDYRPCTLLGAVNTEMGNYALGQEWYAKAVERGATEDSVDKDLRNILVRADQAKRTEMSEFLLRQDPVRYAWVRKLGHSEGAGAGRSERGSVFPNPEDPKAPTTPFA